MTLSLVNGTMLPPLNKLRKKKEADFGLFFRNWLRNNPQCSGAFELKQCDEYLPFSDVRDHQISALLSAKYSGLLWKIADDSRGVKPFDYFYLRDSSAYIVVKYNNANFFCLIDVNVFILEKAKSRRRSLTALRASEIAFINVKI